MKAYSFLMLSVAAAGMLACSGNDAKYVITGMNAPQDGATVYLVDRIVADDIDSTVVVNGAFQMKGKAAKDAIMYVVIEGTDWNYLLFNDGVPIQINCADSSVTGSALNTKLTECDKRNSKSYAQLDRLVRDFLALPKEDQNSTEDEFVAWYQDVYQQFADNMLAIIDENLDNLVPVAFIENVPEVAGYAKFNELVSSDAPFAKHPYVVDLKEGLEDHGRGGLLCRFHSGQPSDQPRRHRRRPWPPRRSAGEETRRSLQLIVIRKEVSTKKAVRAILRLF
jgi:hypothetical protein